MRLEVLTQPTQWVQESPNAFFLVQGKSYLSKFGLGFGLNVHPQRQQSLTFNQDALSRSFRGEVRFYPFAKRQAARERYGCDGMGFSKRPKNNVFTLMQDGIYLAPGYAYKHTSLAYYQRDVLDSPKYSAFVEERAVSLHAGYSLRYHLVTIDFGYGTSFSRPEINDPWQLIAPDAYTIVFPKTYRIIHNLRLLVGINF